MAKRILIVDDDALMRRSLAFNLEQAGFHSNTTNTAENALALARQFRPDLVLLDIGLPGMDGLDALRQFKSNFKVPVIFVTARRRNLDEVVGLELGADDYITKPFDVDVLIAHIKAVLRRSAVSVPISAAEPIQVGSICLDPATHEVSISGKTVNLTPREFTLLSIIAQQPDRVFSIDELLERAWGAEFIGQPQVVYVHMRWLREKIEEDASHPVRIITVRGVGYKLAGGK
ncbi:MAG TPA: response regulator transcription factor [Longilinea sp.]|nr:response regulator transcription factor [Longilinea sp.]